MPVRAKVLEFAASIDAEGRVAAEDCRMLELPPEWTAEHLLLAALLRCSLTSLRYHAKRIGSTASGGGSARGTITQRSTDGRYAFVEIDADLDVTLEPAPDDVGELLLKAERDCFIGASLTAKPSYRWRVNGADL
ncbi:MAG TPA: OsmC family protein [Gaiellaceae bacterium]|nr:OsmC family protein [Gaiellaceae bacterium]